jgi:hypothetical protein
MITPSKKAAATNECTSVKGYFDEAINAALPNAACPGLYWKPLDAAIGRLLTPYRPGGRQGDSKQYKYVICTHFDGRFNGHRNAVVLPCASSDGGLGW